MITATAPSMEETERRILVIDDTESIHEDFRSTLAPPKEARELDLQAAELFGELEDLNNGPHPLDGVVIDSAMQGQQGFEMVRDAIQCGRPYSVAFVDMRMPPGWDGLETIEHLWEIDPTLQIVICSAYSDYSWSDIVGRLGIDDRLLLLKKPFDPAEVCQLAVALAYKWAMTRQANLRIDEIERLAESRALQMRALADRADASEREKTELKRAVDAMEQVLGVIGHELRTPLAAVQLSAEFLSKQSDSGEHTAPFAESIKLEAARMADIMDSMLEAARINSGAARWNWEELDLVEVVQDAIRCCTAPFLDKGLSLIADMPDHPLMMRGDREALFRLTVNLLTNACKYSDAGRTTVTAAPDPTDPHTVVLTVKDQGEGIPPEITEKLGQAFALNRGVVGSAQVKGTGLGLAICSGVVAAHKGTITVHSKVSEGSEFVVRLRADLDEPMNETGQGVIVGGDTR